MSYVCMLWQVWGLYSVSALSVGKLRRGEFSGKPLTACQESILANTAMQTYGATRPGLQSLGVDALYITHWTPLDARRKAMEKQLDELGIPGTFITGHDRENLTDAEVACMYPSNAWYANWTPTRTFPTANASVRRRWRYSWVKLAELSLVIKHVAAWYDAARRGHRNILVVEDDAIFAPGFKESLAAALALPELQQGFDAFDIGNFQSHECAKAHACSSSGRGAVAVPWSLGATAYLISLAGAQKIRKHFPPLIPADILKKFYLGEEEKESMNFRTFGLIPEIVWQASYTPNSQFLHQSTSKGGREFVWAPDIENCIGDECPGPGEWVLDPKRPHVIVADEKYDWSHMH